MILSRGGGDGSGMMRRIKRYHLWNQMPYRESMLWKIFDGLQVRASNAGISTAVIEEAKELYAQLSASTICRGQTQRDALLAACIWESLNRHGSPRMPRDIATIFNISSQNVTKGIKQLQHLLALRTIGQETSTYATVTATDIQKKKETKERQKKITETTEEITARGTARQAILQQMTTRTTTYEDFIVPFLTNLSIPRDIAPELENSVRRVCERIEDLGIVPENTPPSLTASVIAFCITDLRLPIEDTDIARVCGISVVTIQKCLKRLVPWKKKLLEE
jgi:transcription initiation factor TFIIIB Brf1 subunit/transcription initiation factor TFIIB